MANRVTVYRCDLFKARTITYRHVLSCLVTSASGHEDDAQLRSRRAALGQGRLRSRRAAHHGRSIDTEQGEKEVTATKRDSQQALVNAALIDELSGVIAEHCPKKQEELAALVNIVNIAFDEFIADYCPKHKQALVTAALRRKLPEWIAKHCPKDFQQALAALKNEIHEFIAKHCEPALVNY